MKKLVFHLIIILFSLVLTYNVNAISFDVDIVGDQTFENEITSYVQVNNLIDFSGGCNGLCGLAFSLSYDSNKIELIESIPFQSFSIMTGKKIVLYKTTGVPSGTNVLALKFKNKSLSQNEETTITLSNIVASDGEKDISTADVSFKIKLFKKDIITTSTTKSTTSIKTTTSTTTNKNVGVIGSSTTNKRVNTNTTMKTEEETTVLNESYSKSNNNYLSSITLSDGEIFFDREILEYSVTVSNETSNIDINAIAEEKSAIVEGIGNHELVDGENIFLLTVKAENDLVREYKITIIKDGNMGALSNNSQLSDLTIDGQEIKFNKDVYSYKVIIHNKDELDISYVKEDSKSNVNIVGNKDLKNNSIVEIVVTAEDNSQTVYTIEVKDYSNLYSIFTLILYLLIIITVFLLGFLYTVYTKKRKLATC